MKEFLLAVCSFALVKMLFSLLLMEGDTKDLVEYALDVLGIFVMLYALISFLRGMSV